MKIAFISLGCPKNQLDLEVMAATLKDNGHTLVKEDIEADVVIVNTCAFIESALKESIDNILDVAWLKKNRNLKGIVVTGCMAERYRDQIFGELPEVDAVLGVGSIDDICTAVEKVAAGEKYSAFGDKNTSPLGGKRVVSAPKYSSYLKIAEGCDNHCTYCVIPSIRGKYRSREMDDLIEEAKVLEKEGVKELTLIAQDTTRYGLDLYGEKKLPELLRRLVDETGIEWFRVLYCYPEEVTEELAEVFNYSPRILPYIDLPIQHISDKVLRRMNRRGGEAAVRRAVDLLRERVKDIAIRTTIIVGFPGETEEDVEQLCDFVDEAKFDRLGVFTYSPEEDTPAASFDDQIEEEEKVSRMDSVMRRQLEISAANNAEKVGKTIRVLCEDYDVVAETYFGRSEADAPEIDGKVYFSSKKKVRPGTFVDVKIEEAMDYDLVGKAVFS